MDWWEIKISADGKLRRLQELSEILFRARSWVFFITQDLCYDMTSLGSENGVIEALIGTLPRSQISRSTQSAVWECNVT